MLWFIVRKKYILQDMEDKDDKLYTKLDLHNLAHIQVG